MPIRFYCPFCDHLLAISMGEAAAVVECPSCRGEVGVPSLGRPSSGGIVLRPGQLVAVSAGLLVLAALAFVAGLLVGALR